jgi:hypothetical protein
MGYSSVAERLEASQEGLSSIGVSSEINFTCIYCTCGGETANLKIFEM